MRRFLRGFAGAVCLLWSLSTLLTGAPQSGRRIEVTVRDQNQLAVPGVRVELRVELSRPGSALTAATTDESGHAIFPSLNAAKYHLSLQRKGFETVERDVDLETAAGQAVEVTLLPAATRTEVEVKGVASAVEAGSTTATSVAGSTLKELPNRPETVSAALPLIPGVVREPGGGLRISDAGEHRSALIVNSADVTDPATGQFGLTVPIDSVEALNVYQTPFLAEYGRFTAGLVSVETHRGGDKWKFELNDPFPEFRIRSWQLRGLKTATPRVNFEGPIVRSRLFLSEGIEYAIRKTAVYTLPFPDNQKRQEGVNSFSQLDWIASDKHLVTATLHLAPQRMGNWNINYFNPVETSPDARTHNYTGTVADRVTLGSSLFENTFSVTTFDAGVWGKGGHDLVITPGGNSGDYFAGQQRSANRISGQSAWGIKPVSAAGAHHFKIGTYAAASHEDGHVEEHPIDIRNQAGHTIERISFNRVREFEISDVELNFFAQDHWMVSPRLSLDLGARVESQQISGAQRGAPRAGFAWNPFAGTGTTVRGGFGFFYDHVPLNVYCFNRYPDQVITHYGDNGAITGGPYLFLNTLGQTRVRHPFLIQKPQDGNFSPRSQTWTLQVEQPLSRRLKLRAGYTLIESDGLVILNPTAPDLDLNLGSYLLTGDGSSRYRQFEATLRFHAGAERELFFSYVRSKGRGDLNDFGNYLGTFPVPVVRGNQFGNLAADLPNRVLAWGLMKLPARFRIAPVVEYRSGFPYAEMDAAQNYSGVPNETRFPRFLSIDSRVSKDLQVSSQYAVRFSVSGFNLTNHFNPEAVHANLADPAHGLFFGHRGRRFTVDFDVLF